MDYGDEDNSGAPPAPGEDDSRSAVNSLILDYYKKFGRKRDLEQYFSLSTAQSDVRDPSSSFWKSMKTDESSDSGERSDKKSDSSQELCRISIRCSVPDPQEEDTKTKSESVSPPIIIEEVSPDSRQYSEDDAIKSDDNHSQKSFDVLLDTSTNKPLSPSSSVTSQRKLEWDSLADVGYANESDRKTSASSLSTLERLALKQQYSNNDTQQSDIGPPTSHSTPLDDEVRSKNKKGAVKKSSKIYKKDVDFVEVNVPHSSSSIPSQSINVNLTKHISFNVEKDGKVTVGSVQKDISVSPEKVAIEEVLPMERIDKEIQTSLLKNKDANALPSKPANISTQSQKIPILISLNTLRRTRRKRFRLVRRKLKTKKIPEKIQERSAAEQLSEAESFEYMPGHIYNQNQMTANERHSTGAGNKSSLESSAALTTDSSKGSKHSFTKDLEKGIDLLKNALQNRCDDAELKKKLIKQVCQRLLNSQYRDDDSTTDFLSGLSFSSKKLGLDNHTTTSTSDANNSAGKSQRPKKSILRPEKFNPGSIASTSQSAPNLPIASRSDKLVTSNLTKTFTSSNTDSDMSSKDKTSSDNLGPKTSSDTLYQKYLQALKREETYKRHLKDKEVFLKQKLVSSDSALKVPVRVEVKSNNRLKDLINDLTRNNYDDGSGDASKLEGGPGSGRNFDRLKIPNRTQRSHSVFTLSSGNSDCHKKLNLKKKLQCDIKDLSKPGPSKDNHYCCCPHHSGIGKITFADSSVQVNINNPCTDESCPGSQKISPRIAHIAAPMQTAAITNEDRSGEIKYVCHCQANNAPNDVYRYPSLLPDVQNSETCNEITVNPCNNQNCPFISRGICNDKCHHVKSTGHNPQIKRLAKSSQTNMLLKMLRRKSSEQSSSSNGKMSSQEDSNKSADANVILSRKESLKYEATRCIQTEISIDPRIYEPTLSDINIVNECECVKIIDEHRKSSKSSIIDLYIPQIDAETCTNSDTIKSSGTSNNRDNECSDENNSQANDVCKKYNIENCNLNTDNKNNNSEKFTIPIQGTNMTLMVTIGPERNNYMNKKSESLVPNPAKSSELLKLSEMSSKSDQSYRDKIDHNSNLTVTTNAPEVLEFGKNHKTNIIVEQNRDILFHGSNVGKERSIQTDLCSKRDAETQENVPIQTQTSDHTINKDNDSKYQKCSCGCLNSEETCKGKCKDNGNSNKSYGEKSVSKDFQCNANIPRFNNKELTTEKMTYNKCECGCGGTKDNCIQNCINSSKPIECRSKRKLDKQLSKPNLIEKPNEKCCCGCDGIKDDCRKDCAERSGTLKEPCRNNTLEKNLNVRSICDKQNEKCSCGCNGIQENCQKDCVGCKVISGEPCGKKALDKKIGGHNLLDKQNEKCSCGCNGIKEDCKEDCTICTVMPVEKCENGSVVKSSGPKKESLQQHDEKCSCGCGGIKDNCQRNCTDVVTPKGECRKQSLPDKLCDQGSPDNLPSLENKSCCQKVRVDETSNNSCPCGCSGSVDKCTQNCTERKSSLIVLRPPKFKLQNTNKKDECPCGCGNPREHCKEDCSRKSIISLCDKMDVGTQKDLTHIDNFIRNNTKAHSSQNRFESNVNKVKTCIDSRKEHAHDSKTNDKHQKSSSEAEQTDPGSDPILNLIKDITKRYSKKDTEKSRRKKCFTDIVLALNYLLETDDSNAGEGKGLLSSTTQDSDRNNKKVVDIPSCQSSSKKLVDKAVQLPRKPSKIRDCITQSSDIPTSTDIPGTSSDSAACKVLNKIKKECEKYHQKRCKVHNGKKCDASSSTSMNCDQCKRVHYCACRNHKCKGHKRSIDKIQKGPVAYNLILQTSESVISEGTVCDNKNRQLKNIIVKVPKRKPVENIPFKEMASKFERNMPPANPINLKSARSRSLPNESEISSMDEIIRKSRGCTVREYLEKNRPDFVENCSQRQSCLKYISQSRANERAVQRDLLEMYLAELPDVTSLDGQALRQLASDLGQRMRNKKPAPKFISEREMKKRSEKIYKSLPEVVKKKEEIKKENIKKTNLLMANIFKKNLQKKTLRGSVNLSNYSNVIKI